MARREYPDHRDDGAFSKPDGNECEACGQPATHWVRIAWDYMRGNDDIYKACGRHVGIARRSAGQFVAHMNTKDKHLGRQPAEAEEKD